MIQDLIDLFRRAYDNYGDKLILDNYTLKDGLYIRINEDGSKDYLVIKATKNKDGSIEYIPLDYQNEQTSELYTWFKEKDYYSSVKDMNKAIDPKKKIHSNNYLTVFIKKDNLIGDNKLTDEQLGERIKDYYRILSNPKIKNKDARSAELLELIKPRVDEEDVKRKYDYLISDSDSIRDEILKRNDEFDNYVKIFFSEEGDSKKYELEYRRYLIPNLFNKNDFNVKSGSAILGLSNNNMGMNSKKPYLELKTTKFKVPYRITYEDALILGKFFDWLGYQKQGALYIPVDYDFKTEAGNRDNLINNDCYYLYITKGKEITIEDYEFLPKSSYKIDFTLKNYLLLGGSKTGNKYLLEDKHLNQLWELESEIDETFFNKKLKGCYFIEPKITSDFSKKMLNLLIISRNAFYNYFYKGNMIDMISIIDKVSIDFVKEYLYSGELNKAQKAQNLRLSLLNYFELEGKYMGGMVKELCEEITKKLDSADVMDLDNDNEFYFLAGQLAYFILSKSKEDKKKKTHKAAEGFINAKNDVDIKKELLYYFDRYKHAISFDDKRFNKALSMVQGYEAKYNKNKEDIFICGLLTKNIF
jgi:CRISPR-associated protein Csh1